MAANAQGGRGEGTPYDALYGEAPPAQKWYLFQAAGMLKGRKSTV